MARPGRGRWAAGLAIVAWLASGCSAWSESAEALAVDSPRAPGRVEVAPPALGPEAHVPNPYMGWVAYARPSDPPAPDAFDLVSVLVDWNALEPAPERFDWSILERAIDVQGRAGRPVSARLYLMPDPYWGLPGIPGWVTEEHGPVWCGASDPGCSSDRTGFSHPPYWGPAYRGLAERFLRAFALRFAGRVEWVDVRCYGIYGEWDAAHDGAFPWEVAPAGVTKRATLEKWLDLYRRAFEGSGIDLVVNLPGYPSVEASYLEDSGLAYALERGFALRYDAFRPKPSVPYAAQVIEREWRSRFVVAEPGFRRPHPETGELVPCGWCPWTARPVLIQMLRAHANYASLGVEPRHWSELGTRHADLIELGRAHMGYRLVIRRVGLPASVVPGELLHVMTVWSNLGVGRLPHPARLHASLVDDEGRVVWEREDACAGPRFEEVVHGGPFEPGGDRAGSALQVEAESCFEVPAETPPGEYQLRLQVREERQGRALRIAQEGADERLRYAVGRLAVRAAPPGPWWRSW